MTHIDGITKYLCSRIQNKDHQNKNDCCQNGRIQRGSTKKQKKLEMGGSNDKI